MSAEEFKKQYMPYQEKLYKIAFRMLGDSSDAEDMVQEVYIKLWGKRKELVTIDNKEAFCVTTIKNICLDFLRMRSKRSLQPLESLQVAENVRLPEQIDAKSDLERIEHLMEHLPKQQKEILILKHYDGYSFEEIENITGLTNVHIRVLLSRGRKKIRELFTLNA